MKFSFNTYKMHFLRRVSTVQKSLPMMVSALLLMAFGLSLCLEYAVQWAMKGPLWHGVVLVFVAIGVVWLGQLSLHAFSGRAMPKPQKESTEAPSAKEEKQNLGFPFDVLAGHHCAVLVSFDSPLPKTYLIPNVAKVVPNAQPDADLKGGALVEKTVGHLRHKGYPIHVLKPERTPTSGYSPFLGNPKRDVVRVHPFDMVFINWN